MALDKKVVHFVIRLSDCTIFITSYMTCSASVTICDKTTISFDMCDETHNISFTICDETSSTSFIKCDKITTLFTIPIHTSLSSYAVRHLVPHSSLSHSLYVVGHLVTSFTVKYLIHQRWCLVSHSPHIVKYALCLSRKMTV